MRLSRRSLFKALAGVSLVGVPQLSAQKFEPDAPICTFVRKMRGCVFVVNAHSPDVQVTVNRSQQTIIVTSEGQSAIFSSCSPDFTIQQGRSGVLYDVSVVEPTSEYGESLSDCIQVDLESLA